MDFFAKVEISLKVSAFGGRNMKKNQQLAPLVLFRCLTFGALWQSFHNHLLGLHDVAVDEANHVDTVGSGVAAIAGALVNVEYHLGDFFFVVLQNQ